MMMRSKTSFKGLNQEYKDICKLIKKSVRETRTAYEKWIAMESKNNPKLIYSYINNQKKNKDRIRALMDDSGKLVVDKKAMANLLNDKFLEVFNIDNGETLPQFYTRCREPCILDLEMFSSVNISKH